MAERPLNVAIVGTGGIYRLAHGPAWRRIPRAKVVATCDVVEQRAVEARREVGAEAHYTSVETLLEERRDVDVVDVCTPSDSHADIAVSALEAGKHVIVEKPMALRPDDAARMIRAAERADRQLFVGHTRRFDERWTTMKDQISSGRVGDPVAIRRSERCWGPFAEDDWHWSFALSGGVLMDLGIHVLDLFSWFYDDQPTRVYAKTLAIRPEASRKGCHDFATVLVDYPGGRRGLLEVSWAHPKAYAPFYSDTEVVGTRGKLTLSDKDTSPMTVVRAEGAETARFSPLLSATPDAFVQELSHFLDCIEGKEKPRITASQAARAVAAIDAAYRSVETGRPVAVQGVSA